MIISFFIYYSASYNLTSRFLDNGIEAKQKAFFWWGLIRPKDKEPVLVMRKFRNPKDFDKVEDSFGKLYHYQTKKGYFQKIDFLEENLPKKGGIAASYQKINVDKNGNEAYELSYLVDGKKQIYYYADTKRLHVIEDDGRILDLWGEYMPYALRIVPPGIFGPYFVFSVLYHGTYYGEEVTFMGGCDRFFTDEAVENCDSNSENIYITNVLAGIDENGVKECGCIYMLKDKQFAWYYKDGQEPKVSEHPNVYIKWVEDPNDNEKITAKEVDWSFDDIKIHWRGEYTTQYAIGPRVDTTGIWYEENGSRNFKTYFDAVESRVLKRHLKDLPDNIKGEIIKL